MAERIPHAEAHVEGAKKNSDGPKWKWRTSTLGLILMALATLGSSWCGYQSTVWEGIQMFRLVDSAEVSRNAHELAVKAMQQRALDAALFVEYARDINDGKTRLADFFLARMRPELRDAIQAWVATHPLKNPDAPATPFRMPQYKVKEDSEVEKLNAESRSEYAAGRFANRTSDTYMLLAVLYATSLFLAGLVSAVEERRPRIVTLFMATIIFSAATILLTRLPVAKL
jgi:hypothetical protein